MRYFEYFGQLREAAMSDDKLFDAMVTRYPHWVSGLDQGSLLQVTRTLFATWNRSGSNWEGPKAKCERAVTRAQRERRSEQVP
jgi:hypothetical protein